MRSAGSRGVAAIGRAALAACTIASSACAVPAKFVLQDDTALPSVVARCGPGSAAPARCKDRLTTGERKRLEELLAVMVSDVPASAVPRVRLQVLSPGAQLPPAWHRGNTIVFSAPYVAWALRDVRPESVGRAVMTFAIGHEIGHLLAPSCGTGCDAMLDCERQADEISRRLFSDESSHLRNPYLPFFLEGGLETRSRVVGTPDILVKLADDAERTFTRSVSAGSAAAGQLGDDAERCVRTVELLERFSDFAVEHAVAGVRASWSERQAKREQLVAARDRRLGRVTRLARRCDEIVARLPPDRATCVRARLSVVQEVVQSRARDPIPGPNDPLFWPAATRWHDDADVIVSIEGAATWARFPASHLGSLTGWRSRVLAAWQGGMPDGASIGLRLGYGESGTAAVPWNAAARPEVRILTAEAVARWVMPLRRQLAFVSDLSLGAAQLRPASDTMTTSYTSAVDVRMAWAFARRAQLSVGVGYALAVWSGRFDMHGAAATIALDLDVGNYGERHLRSSDRPRS